MTKRKRKSSSSEESEPENENENEDEESDSSQSKDVPKHYHVRTCHYHYHYHYRYRYPSSPTLSFQSGNFVLLKTDVKWEGDDVVTKLKDLYLWKIDGKALLQKFVPVVSDGKIVHKCTCVVSTLIIPTCVFCCRIALFNVEIFSFQYSGWNVDNRENYYPISDILNKNVKTDFKVQCVALNLSDLVKVRDKR